MDSVDVTTSANNAPLPENSGTSIIVIVVASLFSALALAGIIAAVVVMVRKRSSPRSAEEIFQTRNTRSTRVIREPPPSYDRIYHDMPLDKPNHSAGHENQIKADDSSHSST
uniref:uncharacterized protein LOC120342245 n=1 Tax=Styela clava TaxID=7725 RepID=UPI001939D5FF|nr:uncharacterized protein LOC120342245 [Styela clava]